jgi:vanillate O-demethylase monooxygenase subunit
MEQGIVSCQVHWFTPISETETHYFYAMTVPKVLGEQAQAMADEAVQQVRAPFEFEDAPLIEAQQRNLGEKTMTEMKPLILNIDAAGSAARRRIDKLLKQEASEN